MRGPLPAILVALTAAGSAACGPDASRYPYVRLERVNPDAGADGDAAGDGGLAPIPAVPLEDWDIAGAGPLTGIFAVEVTVKAKVVIDIESRQLYRLRLLQRGRQVRQRASLCRLLLPSVEGVADIRVPPALEAVLRARAVEGTGDWLTAEDPVGAGYAPEAAPIIVGAELADPVADPLPTPEDPSTAVDEDEDGHPGVTLVAEAFVCEGPEELYAALRTTAALSGTVEDLDTLSGEVLPTLDQSVLGYSADCLGAAANLPISLREGSTFSALRVAGERDLDGNGNVSCEEVVRAAPELFGAHWLPEAE